MRFLRLAKIVRVGLTHGLDALILEHEPTGRLRWLGGLLRAVCFWRDLSAPRAVRLRLALEALGPIFVKFGQVLSTRRDLLPLDIADELAKLQDQVPPFPSEQAIAVIECAFGRSLDRIYSRFDREPVASASVAQVHFATLPDGREVAVKILRPGIEPVIAKDLALLDTLAGLLESLWSDGKRLKPHEVVAEFAKHLADELDLMREAANCSQLRRNFKDSKLLAVPEVHWDYCTSTVMTMEHMRGIPISQIDRLREAGIDLSALSRAGVEIFFTQVFRDGFFHADMHPGNILVATEGEMRGRYIALDFGIMGTLNETDQRYLAINFLAFFRRDYKRVAEAHIESGWAPATTRVDELEAAIRAVCEPIFDRPLKEISFGKVLLRLFQTSRRFNVEIQPQLVLLQKTLLNIEGLGRQLDPDLDLWQTAKPFLERWMSEQVGWRGLVKNIKLEAPLWARTLPQLPRLLHQALTNDAQVRVADELKRLRHAQNWRNRWLALIVALLAFLVLMGVPGIGHATTVRFLSALGVIDVALHDTEAPLTVTNFLNYVNAGKYTNTLVHRSVPGFVIQGGGYTWDSAAGGVKAVATATAVTNEFSASRSNVRGTIAMAKVGSDPNSATSQWFFNLADNASNLDSQNGGFTVFGRVLGNGMAVADAIAALTRVNAGSVFTELPVTSVPSSGSVTDAHLVLLSSVGVLSAATSSDRIFNYLEANYASYLAPANATSATVGDYYYRYYSRTGAYIATSGDALYYLGPASNYAILKLGSLADFLALAASAGY